MGRPPPSFLSRARTWGTSRWCFGHALPLEPAALNKADESKRKLAVYQSKDKMLLLPVSKRVSWLIGVSRSQAHKWARIIQILDPKIYERSQNKKSWKWNSSWKCIKCLSVKLRVNWTFFEFIWIRLHAILILMCVMPFLECEWFLCEFPSNPVLLPRTWNNEKLLLNSALTSREWWVAVQGSQDAHSLSRVLNLSGSAQGGFVNPLRGGA